MKTLQVRFLSGSHLRLFCAVALGGAVPITAGHKQDSVLHPKVLQHRRRSVLPPDFVVIINIDAQLRQARQVMQRAHAIKAEARRGSYLEVLFQMTSGHSCVTRKRQGVAAHRGLGPCSSLRSSQELRSWREGARRIASSSEDFVPSWAAEERAARAQ